FITAVSSPPQRFRISHEESDLRMVRRLLDCDDLPPPSPRYPLRRFSSESEGGNRKNLVIFLLESWSAKDLGCLGGKAGVTPFFDGLAQKGLLFRNFFATGIRTPEALISVLYSFPNQPVRPIMGRSAIYQTHWRSLSQILSEAGYRTSFLYGRDLEFAHAREFLQFIRFDQVIDKRDFPSSAPPTGDSWAGYDDEELMHQADREFSRQGSHPFFAVISTMNTHPPFTIPKGFPRAFPPTSLSNKFLNSLHYSDYALGKFFKVAESKPYFQNTVFLLVADHARTREEVSLSAQHHIPLLIYAPGVVKPGVREVVGSQVDLLPTVLGLLQLKASHASWGRNLLQVGEEDGFAVSVSGNEVRWRNGKYLLNDSLTDQSPFLFDIIKDPDCTTDLWEKKEKLGKGLQAQLRAYISLSQALLYQNRIHP
ncbi:MAG: LTA synthase family protein, partial [candidate division NC10 bacterium]|nr:LTA synthase family protein [candidate division NC10 bacterium]